jgi:deoxyadenosine/deoxycytidine kinase
MEQSKIYYATFGGPGTGKTTLLKKIVNNFPEYHYSGNDSITTDGSILNKYHKKIFYDNDYSYFFKFQMEVLPLRFWQTEECKNNSFVDEMIFDALAYSKALKKINWISDEEFHTFYQNYRALESFITKPKTVIYFHCDDIFLVLSRLAKRGRAIEKKFSIEYLEALLESFHEVSIAMKGEGLNVIELDIKSQTEQAIYDTVVKELNLQRD